MVLRRQGGRNLLLPPQVSGGGRMNVARQYLQILWVLESLIASIALFIIAGLLLADVVGREFFNHGLFGALRGAVYAMAISGLLGFGLCVASNSHVRISALDGIVPISLRPIVTRLGDIASALICALLAYWAIRFVAGTITQNEMALSLGMPVWPFQMVLPWMFLSATSRYVVFAIWPQLRPEEPAVAA
ncbi:TRAP transporter small permease [Chelatococcus asaccharovorans]|nr:TRAP transporter small permease [Chelatococcus asaccharovorans]